MTKLSPIADTLSGAKARESPTQSIVHYENLVAHLWLPPKVSEVADTTFDEIRNGRPAWASLIGPYGFGKTAAAISVWNYAREKEFLAIPPLSCTNFDELAHGVAALAIAQAPQAERKIRHLFKKVWTEELDSVVRSDTERYQVSKQKLRRLLQDKLTSGQMTLDKRCHRLVEFLAKLGDLATEWSNGLVVVLDELQQLLGPLDTQAIINFREFVWGMRTERSHCGVIIAIDSLLEARLARWATDILHRIREHGPSLQLSFVYEREFPAWLWAKLTTSSSLETALLKEKSLTPDVLISLGQFVERSDISNGPRTVMDVFMRAGDHYRSTNKSYDIPDLIEDIYRGRFRYFGEGAILQTVLTHLLADDYILKDRNRETMVRTLAAFPLGCPPKVLHRFLPNEKKLRKAKSELFGPLLVDLKEGLALERIQNVRRPQVDWEQIIARCWDTLPALDALAAHMPDILRRVLVPMLFPKGNPANPQWQQVCDEADLALSNWSILRGTFDDSYPLRDVGLCIGHEEPKSWPSDVDLCVLMICDSRHGTEIQPSAFLLERDGTPGIVFRMPVMKPLDQQMPAELERYRKYIQPEPFRSATFLSAVHELEVFLGDSGIEDETKNALSPLEEETKVRRARAFSAITLDFVTRELIQGAVEVLGSKRPIQLRGIELLRALFASVCRRRFPEYQTLVRTPDWRSVIETYRKGVKYDGLSLPIRQGREAVTMPKSDMMRNLFDQNSTAAGDSVLRILGDLVETSGTPQEFSIRLNLHPAEVLLLNYLKGLKRAASVPSEAAKQYLRHHGYVEAETEQIIRLLIDRELLVEGRKGTLQVVGNTSATRSLLIERIAVSKRQLEKLNCETPESLPQTESIKTIQAYVNELERLLAARIEEQLHEVENTARCLRELIGGVLATTLVIDWAPTDLSMHFLGVASALQQTRDDLLKALRKELKRTEDEISRTRQSDAAWAIGWRKKRDSFLSNEQRLRDRVEQLLNRSAALNSWVPHNDQLRATGILCDKVCKTDPGPKKRLSKLLSTYREKFSVDTWSVLFKVTDFADRLISIEIEVQGLLYRQLQSFLSELETLKKGYSTLLPPTEPPVFDRSAIGSVNEELGRNAFGDLYNWALAGFRSVVNDCRQRKLNRLPWRDRSSSHMSWKDMDEQVEKALKAVNGAADFKAIIHAGDKALRMLSGFTSGNGKPNGRVTVTAVYDNPSAPPDFEHLKESFVQGQVVIRVEPRKHKSKTAS